MSMTTAPNPTVSVSTIDGKTRTLDDWTTVFSQCWVVLPSKSEAIDYIPLAEQIFKTFGDSDARCAYLIPGGVEEAKRIMEHTTIPTQCFIDPDFKVCDALGITHAPSLVYVRQDTSVAHIAQGFTLSSWTQTCKDIAASLRWTAPKLSDFSDLAPANYFVK
jgi:hypothetical protein